MATDGRKRAAQSVWERLDAEKAGVAGRPFDEHGSDWVASGVGAMPVKLSEEEERAQWAADLAAVAEQRKAEPPPLDQTTSSINPHEWDLPSGAADAAAQAKAVYAPAPADVQRQWVEDLAAVRAEGPQHGRRSVNLDEPRSAHSDASGCHNAEAGVQPTAPFGLEQDNPAHAKPPRPAAAPQAREEVQAQWRHTFDAAHADHPRFARTLTDVHAPVPSSGHGAVLSSDGAIKVKPAAPGARAVERVAKTDRPTTKTKSEVVHLLDVQQRRQSTEPRVTGEVTTPRKMSRARLDALAAPKQTYSPRENDRDRANSEGGSVASARSATSSTRRESPGIRHHKSARPQGASSLQQRQAWKAVASAARESLEPEAWAAMSRAEKKDFLRAAIAQHPGVSCTSKAHSCSADLDAQSTMSASDSVLSDISAASSRRSVGSSIAARTASTNSTSRTNGSGTNSARSVKGAKITDVHATVHWNVSDQFGDSNSGHQDDRFVSSMQASMSSPGGDSASNAAPAASARASRIMDVHAASSWHVSEQFTGTRDGQQDGRFVTSARASHQHPRAVHQQDLKVEQMSKRNTVAQGGRRQPAITTAALQASSFSLG